MNSSFSTKAYTVDYLCGDFKLMQLKNGHRFSTDDLLVAYFVQQNLQQNPKNILELGSGIGTISHLLAWIYKEAQITAIEAQEESFELFKKNIELNKVNEKIKIIHSDFRETNLSEKFDLIVGSPPYFAVGSGVLSPHSQRKYCRFELRGSVVDYCLTASRYLSPNGKFIFVFPLVPSFQGSKVANGLKISGLRLEVYQEVVLKESEEMKLGLFCVSYENVVDSKILEPLTIRKSDGSIDAQYDKFKEMMGINAISKKTKELKILTLQS